MPAAFGTYVKTVRGMAARKLGLLLSGASSDDASAPTLTAGSGAPSASEPNGSLYLRTSGLLYRRIGGAWEQVLSTTGALIANTIAELTAAAGVTIDGLRIKDAAIAPVAGGAVFIDLTACATGEADVVLGDNLADALSIREAANSYLRVTTTDDAERITLQKIAAFTVTTVDMADAAHALVYGTAGAAQTKLLGNLLVCDPNSSGASEELTLPAEATSTGVLLMIVNSGGEGIVVKDDGGGTVLTLDTAQHGIAFCDGTTWRGFMGAVT